MLIADDLEAFIFFHETSLQTLYLRDRLIFCSIRRGLDDEICTCMRSRKIYKLFILISRLYTLTSNYIVITMKISVFM